MSDRVILIIGTKKGVFVAEAAKPRTDTINAHQRTSALKAAIELDLFTAIGPGDATAEHLADKCAASTRGIRILCDYLTVVGFLRKRAGAYCHG